ncbi:hypothetical protein PU629_07240 [Pullulanibacillus sp. KACC 23026]|uniref:hypothetical protein n=1 Tax=Pullulanibacillus sp. KACC 23026 TaxID=3028315 RepID=UPI0023B13816|nr:hypothetical protein [Pullulanibacillus sp. KACC 23026]WEG14151.1 hypothetical protein PU629_07240 [Pullulanibacillus sp. KACC 23026]
MKYTVQNAFKDKNTNAIYHPGDVYETEDAKRAGELQKRGFLGDEIKSDPAPTPPQDPPADSDQQQNPVQTDQQQQPAPTQPTDQQSAPAPAQTQDSTPLLDRTVDEVIANLSKDTPKEVLNQLLLDEKAGKNRKTVTDYIESLLKN